MLRFAGPACLLEFISSATSAVAWTAVGLFTVIRPAAAQPGHTDYFSTTGGGAQAKYDQEKNSWERRANLSDNFRTRSKGCLSILDEALVHMRRSDELFEQFRQQKIHSDHPDFNIYREAGNESQSGAALIDKFHKCLRPFMAIMVDDINSGGGSGNGDEYSTGGNNLPASRYDDPFSDRIETGDKICDMQRVALLIKDRYQRPGKPLASYEVKGFDPVMGRPGAKTFLLVAQGVDNKDFWNYWLAQVTRAYSQNSAAPETRAITNISKLVAGESYSRAILKAIKSLPKGASIILAGHSLGGIEMQNLVHTIKEMGHPVPYLLTFGAPIVAPMDPGTLYRYVKADGDLVAWADRRVGGSSELIKIGGGDINPWNTESGSHHIYWNSPQLAGLSVLGDKMTSRTPCLEINLGSLREYEAEGLGEDTAGPKPINNFPLCPNCFWSAIAQDLRWAHPGQKFAAPNHGAADWPTARKTLKELYGSDNLISSSEQEIRRTLCQSGVGSRGIVIVWDEISPFSHAFNARCVPTAQPGAINGGRVVFWDAQNVDPSNNDPRYNLPIEVTHFGGASKVVYFQTK